MTDELIGGAAGGAFNLDVFDPLLWASAVDRTTASSWANRMQS